MAEYTKRTLRLMRRKALDGVAKEQEYQASDKETWKDHPETLSYKLEKSD